MPRAQTPDLQATTVTGDKIADPIRQSLNDVIDAWEALPGGRDYRPREVAEWLAKTMAPAIDSARVTLGRERPRPA